MWNTLNYHQALIVSSDLFRVRKNKKRKHFRKPEENPNRIGERIYIRDCYKKLTSFLLKKPGKKGGAIAGSPGVGKTVFLVYFLKEILAKDPTAKVLFCNLLLYKSFLVTKNECLELGPDTRRNLSYVARKEGIYILVDDKVDFDFSYAEPNVFLFDSTNRDNFHSFRKYFFPVFYIPSWTRDEILLCDKVLNPNSKDSTAILSRYETFGGKARYIFKKEYDEQTLKLRLQLYLLGLREDAFKVFDGTKFTFTDTESLALVVHAVPDELGPFRDYRTEFAAPWIKEFVRSLINNFTADYLLEFFEDTQVSDKNAVYGSFFRNLVFSKIKKGGAFPIRELGSDCISQINVTPCSPVLSDTPIQLLKEDDTPLLLSCREILLTNTPSSHYWFLDAISVTKTLSTGFLAWLRKEQGLPEWIHGGINKPAKLIILTPLRNFNQFLGFVHQASSEKFEMVSTGYLIVQIVGVYL